MQPLDSEIGFPQAYQNWPSGLNLIIIIVTSFAPISSKIKLSGATKPGD